MRLKIIILLFSVTVIFTLSTYLIQPSKDFRIIGTSTAKEVNEKLKPVGITNAFPPETSTIYCWFEWAGAKPNTSIMTSWYYVTEDIHILDYTFDIPRKSGSGSVSLSMPQGKELPAGAYRVDLRKKNRILRSLNFRILEKS